jgi:hypothetical protein
MTVDERKDLLYALVSNYIIESEKNEVYNRENATSYTYSKGVLVGACMALGLDLEEDSNSLTIVSGKKKKIICKFGKGEQFDAK